MNEITLDGIKYTIIDTKEKISIADSFVVPQNKTGTGNGEAKLYIGQDYQSIKDFFGERGFVIDCIVLKKDLLQYLLDSENEYLTPTQEYREKNNMSSLLRTRHAKVEVCKSLITFKLFDQNQLSGSRIYLNSDEKEFQLIREISLPNYSYLNIHKLKKDDHGFLFYLELKFNLFDIPIENESCNENIEIKTPFNPNKIKVRSEPSTIGQVINDLEDNIINLDTDFQRLPNLWDQKKKSRFIESIILKLPIPAFYFYEKEENLLEVVDGLQRISTIKSFAIDKTLVLQNLEFLTEYNGSTFDSLPGLFSRRIKTFTITIYTIEKGTPDEVKYNIFKRVNTGGLVLTPQEIRHAINQGTPSELVADLVRFETLYNEDGSIKKRKSQNGKTIELNSTKEGIAFAKATCNSIGTFRMEDRDFATRFISFYLIPYKEYEPDLDTFLNKGMSKIKELSDSEISSLKSNFAKSMTLAFDIFGNDAFRKRFNPTDSRRPINKALFEVLSVNFAKLSDTERKNIFEKKESFKEKFIQLHNEKTGKFIRSITQGTAQKDSVENRFKLIEKIINDTLEND